MRGCLQILLVIMVCGMLLLVAISVAGILAGIAIPSVRHSRVSMPPLVALESEVIAGKLELEPEINAAARELENTGRMFRQPSGNPAFKQFTDPAAIPFAQPVQAGVTWAVLVIPLSLVCCLLLFAVLLLAFRRRRKEEDPPENESRMIHELYQRSLAMEERVETLETLLLEKMDPPRFRKS